MACKRKRMPGRVVTWGRKRKQQKGETNNIRDWAGLHDYLLEDVMERLPLADCLSFGSVCKPWGSVATKFLDGSYLGVPCLVKRDQNENEVTARSCFSILEKSKFEMELPEAYGSCVWGSFQDWLFLGRREKCHLHISLLNPFSRENISLPVTIKRNYLMVMSKVPSDENCVCMLVGSGGMVSFWTPGLTKWHEIYLDYFLYCLDALYYGGCFYLLGDYNNIFVINEKNVISLLNAESSARVRVSTQSLSIKLPGAPKFKSARHYLVESRGEILLVCRFFHKDDARIGVTTAFETYRLDIDNTAWLKLENLEDQILFVGTCCSRAFHAKDLGHALANKVYFMNEGPFVDCNEWNFYHACLCRHSDGDDWGCFSFQNPNHWPSVFQARAKRWAGVWLTTPIGWCLKQRHG